MFFYPTLVKNVRDISVTFFSVIYFYKGEEQSTSNILEELMATDDLDNMPEYEEEQVEENGEEHEIQDLNGQEANGQEDPDEQEYTEELIKSMGEEEEEEEGEDGEEGEEEEADSEPEPTPPTKISKAPQRKATVPPPPPPAKKATAPPPQKKTTAAPIKNAAPPAKPAPAQLPVKPKAPVKEQPKQKPVPEKAAPLKKIAPPENPSKTNGAVPKKSLKPDVSPAIAKNPSPDTAPKRKLAANEEEQLEAEEPPKKKTKAPASSKSSKTSSEGSAEKKDGFGGPTGKKMWFQSKVIAATNNIYERHKERGEEYLKEIDPLEGKSYKEKAKWFRDNVLAFMHFENITELKKIATNKEPFQDLHSPKDFTAEHQKRINEYGFWRYMLANVLQCEYYNEEEDE